MSSTIQDQAVHTRQSPAERAIASLSKELHTLEHGVEPNHERIQRALLELADKPPTRDEESARDLSQRLCQYMRDLRQDEMELSVEDLDVLLESCARLEAMVAETEVVSPQPCMPSPPESRNDSAIEGVASAPEFRDSGVFVASEGPHMRLTLPLMEDCKTTAVVLADLTDLWDLTPTHLGWKLDLKHLERIPVSLLSTLVQLASQVPARPDRVQLIGGLDQIQSDQLQECLDRCFDVVA